LELEDFRINKGGNGVNEMKGVKGGLGTRGYRGGIKVEEELLELDDLMVFEGLEVEEEWLVKKDLLEVLEVKG
jgi:hypothetical protein